MAGTALSEPMLKAFDNGLLDETIVFDYGCGRVDDLRTLAALGIDETSAGTQSIPRRPHDN